MSTAELRKPEPERGTDAYPRRFSVIIEWENLLLAEEGRAPEMLRRLAEQIREVRMLRAVEAEVIVVYDDAECPIADLTRTLEAAFTPAEAIAGIRPLSVTDTPYYDRKNAGAEVSTGDVIVFLDSDVIPDQDWLVNLLAAFEQPEVEVVAGNTYVEPRTFYWRAVAAFWFFPPRSEGAGLVPADALFGNNIAFRRQVFLEHRFPHVDQFRGQCGMLIRELRKAGAGIYLQQSSRCAHPPPNGVWHFMCRALCEGHDNVVAARRANAGERLPWRLLYWSARKEVTEAWRRIRERRTRLGLSPLGVLGALGVAGAWALCVVGGEILTRIDPGIVRRRFSI